MSEKQENPQQKAKAPARVPKMLERGDYPTSEFAPAPWNPRTIDPADPEIAELCEQMKVLQLHDVIARMNPNDQGVEGAPCYQVCAGHRRVIAADKAGIRVRASIYDFNDEEAQVVTAVENRSRKSLDPMEEAKLCGELLAKLDVSDTAGMLDHSIQWVKRRERLLSIIPEVFAIEGSDQWGIGKLEVFALLPAEQQEDLLATLQDRQNSVEDMLEMSTKTFMQLALSRAQSMKLAPWPLKWTGSTRRCTGCPKRESAQTVLPGFETDDDHCLDRACWARHMMDWYNERIEALCTEFGHDAETACIQVSWTDRDFLEYGGDDTKLWILNRILEDAFKYGTAEIDDADAKVFIRFDVEPMGKLSVLYIPHKKGGFTPTPDDMTPAERAEIKRKAKTVKALAAILSDEKAADEHGFRLDIFNDQEMMLLALLLTFGQSAHKNDVRYAGVGVDGGAPDWKKLKDLNAGGQKIDDAISDAFNEMMITFTERLRMDTQKEHAPGAYKEAERICKLFGSDISLFDPTGKKATDKPKGKGKGKAKGDDAPVDPPADTPPADPPAAPEEVETPGEES